MNCVVQLTIICWFSIGSMPLDRALIAAVDTLPPYWRPQLIYDFALIRDAPFTHPIRGSYTFNEALTRMLDGTHVTWVAVNERTYTIVPGDEDLTLIPSDETPIVDLPVADWRR